MKQIRWLALALGVVLVVGGAAPSARAERTSKHDPRVIFVPWMSHSEFHAIGSAVHAPRLRKPAWKALSTTPLAVHNYKADLCTFGTSTRQLGFFPVPNDVPAYEHILDAAANDCSASEQTLSLQRGAIAEEMSRNEIALAGNLYTPRKATGFCKALESGEHPISFAIGKLVEHWFGEGIGTLADFGVSVAIAACPSVLH